MPQSSAAQFQEPTVPSDETVADKRRHQEHTQSHVENAGEQKMEKTPRGWWVFPAALLGLAFWVYLIYAIFIA